MATKTFSFRMENRRFSSPYYYKKALISSRAFRDPKELIDNVSWYIEDTWNEFAKTQGYPPMKFRTVSYGGENLIFEAIATKPYRDPELGSITLESGEHPTLYIEKSGKVMRFVPFMKMYLFEPKSEHIFDFKDGSSEAYYDILEKKWYTKKQYIKLHPELKGII